MKFTGYVLVNQTKNELFRDGAGTKFFSDESEALTYKGLAAFNPTLERSIRGFEPRPATCDVSIPVDAIPDGG